MSYTKVFIGKGKKIDNLDIIKVTCPLEDLQAIAYEYEGTGKAYVTFEVARMKQMDEYGRTHSVYYSKKDAEVVAQKAAPKPRKLKSLGKREVKIQELLPV